MQAMEISSNSMSKVIEVTNKMGVHARPAAMIVRVANKFNDTEVWVSKEEEEVNGKSIMGLMMLAAAQGSKLKFCAEGPDARELIEEMEKLFARKFEEG